MLLSFIRCAPPRETYLGHFSHVRFLGSNFTSSQMSESNPGPLDEKRKHYQRAIPLTSLKDTSCATEPLLLSPTSWQGGIDTLN